MATTDTGGMAHLTVVPENYDPDEAAESDDAGASAGSESSADGR
jgi:hypothetical protein